MKTCFLHIGSEKTGTTSIQKCFGSNRAACLDAGFWYPRSASYKPGAVHRRLSDVALAGPVENDTQFVAEFEREYREAMGAGAHSAIVSSEFFHSRFHDSASIERLRTFLTRYFGRINVIYYARRQDNLAVSMHSTAVRGGNTTVRSALSVYESKGHHYFDHLAVCALWSAQFGRENFTARIFETGKLVTGDVVDDIAAIMGIRDTFGPRQFSANESLSAECMDVLLLFNGSPYRENDTLRRELMRIGKARGGPKIPLLTRSEAQQFVARFDESNAAFFRKYVDPSLATAFQKGFDAYPSALSEPVPANIVTFLFGPMPAGAPGLAGVRAKKKAAIESGSRADVRQRRRRVKRGKRQRTSKNTEL